ncbi:MAG: hypothetical protein HC809_09490 [Gammaproteobacteria bacterium]|nr:hypothetical protein [Gammaproteobacteria bacterium]
MTIDYAGARYAPRQELIDAHADAWRLIGHAGTWWRGEERRAMVAEARHALNCSLCAQRKHALSPGQVSGAHDTATPLSDPVIDTIHRIVTDPGRLTRAWFDGIIAAGVPTTHYVEIVSVVATSIIIDTMHRALGLDSPPLPAAIAGEPARSVETDLVDDGAWVPLKRRADASATATKLPADPNIRRAMSMVASAPLLFFRAFMPHYRLQGLQFAITQGQAEFTASRVSALNQCFY